MRKATRAEVRERKAQLRTIQSTYLEVRISVHGIPGRTYKDVLIAIPTDATCPSYLFKMGDWNRLFCPETGRVFQQTNGKYVLIERTIDPRIIKLAMERLRFEFEEAYPVGCY